MRKKIKSGPTQIVLIVGHCVGDPPEMALANRSLSGQPKLQLLWRGHLHTPCSFT